MLSKRVFNDIRMITANNVISQDIRTAFIKTFPSLIDSTSDSVAGISSNSSSSHNLPLPRLPSNLPRDDNPSGAKKLPSTSPRLLARPDVARDRQRSHTITQYGDIERDGSAQPNVSINAQTSFRQLNLIEDFPPPLFFLCFA